MSQQTVPDPSSRLAFLEAVVPQLIAQRNEALDEVARQRAQTTLHQEAMQREIAGLRGQIKAMTAPKESALPDGVEINPGLTD